MGSSYASVASVPPEGLSEACRLIDGEAGPDGFRRGVELLTALSSKNDGRATEILATLDAAGAGRRQDFGRAFQLLERAAAQGSQRASAQLEILGDRDLARLLAFPERVSLSDEPRIRSAPRFASDAECNWLIERSRGKLERALTYGAVAEAGIADPGRSNSAIEFKLSQLDVVIQVIRTRIAGISRLPIPLFEPPQVLQYQVGQEFGAHYDFLRADVEGQRSHLERFGQRIATFLIYLNDDFAGGETDFPAAGVRFQGRRGDALFFANVDGAGVPDQRTLHAGLPPTSGEKWLFSQWIRDRSPASN